jgi:ribonuclease BN (tRNA processing enzyme)
MKKLFFLGAGTPTPTETRFGSAYVLQIDDEFLMFDCGPAATHKMVKAGLFPTRIDHLFFTHHHFDHNVDYPCFLLSRWDQSIGEENRLNVYGPWPLLQITESLIGENGVFTHDWKCRVEHPGSQEVFVRRGGELPRPGLDISVKEIGDQEVIRTDRWTVKTARVRHIDPWMPTLAYRVEAGGSSIVFSADTGPCKAFDRLALGADTLLIHCWDHQENMDSALAGMIAGTLDAAEMARDAGAGQLILTHQGSNLCRPGSMERGIKEMSAIFDGEIVFAKELMVLELR